MKGIYSNFVTSCQEHLFIDWFQPIRYTKQFPLIINTNSVVLEQTLFVFQIKETSMLESVFLFNYVSKTQSDDICSHWLRSFRQEDF